ncbi:MAG: hypothetical protein GWP37_07160 [Gammaproteobacteria bacterium]|nr:hypothetical protein [Gammaproteobacteria bacterium]
MLVRANLEHEGHDLASTRSESMALRGCKTLPPELYDLARAAADAGQFPSQIDHLIRTRAAQLGLSVTWTEDYIRHQFPVSSLSLDAENVIEELRLRQDRLGCGSEIKCNQAGYITRIFVVLDDAEQEWADCNDNVLLFDITWGTNRSGMKLGCFTTVGKSGHTVILAFVLLDSEAVVALHWAFRCFAKHFKRHPATIFTDEGATILIAVASMQDEAWKGTVHMFCTYHIAKNFYKHVHPAVRDTGEWHSVNSAFWKLAKYSDTQFDPQPLWDWILETVKKDAQPSAGAAVIWLESLWVKRDHWLACLTWKHCSWGIHSTQRAESIHAAIKKIRVANAAVSKLIENLVAFNSKQRDRHHIDEIRASIRMVADACCMSPLLNDLSRRITPYAFDICKAQYARALMYKCDDVGDGVYTLTYAGQVKTSALTPTVGEDGKIVCWQCNADFGTDCDPTIAGHQTSLQDCTCQFFHCFRLPCCHMIMVHIMTQESKLQCDIGDKWLVATEFQRQHNLFNLRSAAPPKPGGSVSRTSITAKERRDILFDEFSCLIDTASRSPESFESLRQCLPALQYAVQHNKVLPLPVDVEVQVEVSPEVSPDNAAVAALLGEDYVVDDGIKSDVILSGGLLGRWVLHKYGPTRWYLAQVTEAISDDTSRNYVVQYSGARDDFGDVYLGLSNRWNLQGKASRYDWVPIKAAELSNVGARTHTSQPRVLPPDNGRGRKPTKRAAPPHGPMSKAANKGSKAKKGAKGADD